MVLIGSDLHRDDWPGNGQLKSGGLHGCLLISERSCEEGNRLLDRAMEDARVEETSEGARRLEYDPLTEP